MLTFLRQVKSSKTWAGDLDGFSDDFGDDFGEGYGGGEYVSPLMQVAWLRMVVDEGHSLGALSITDANNMAR